MYKLTLTWTENGQVRTETLDDQRPSKHFGTFRIGRDPAQCDMILTEPTVSALHVEIFFNPQHNCFYLRNLRESNPPLVDGRSIIKGEAPLRQGSSICLGQMALTVVAVSSVIQVPPTIVMPPKPGEHLPANQPIEFMKIDIDENNKSRLVAEVVETEYFQQLQRMAQQFREKNGQAFKENVLEIPVEVEQKANAEEVNQSEVESAYGSMCPKCHHVSPFGRDLWCTRCGASMATATKVLMNPNGH